MLELKEVKKERDELLLEYYRFEAMHRIMEEREKELSALKNKLEILALNKTAKLSLRKEWRGSLFLRGAASIERIQGRYFKLLLTKIKNLGHDTQKSATFVVLGEKITAGKLEDKLKVYAHDITLRASQNQGTIGKLLLEKQLKWDELKKEVDKVMQDITSLVSMLEHLEITTKTKKEPVVEQFFADVTIRGEIITINTSLVKFMDALKSCPDDELHYLIGFDNIMFSLNKEISYEIFEKYFFSNHYKLTSDDTDYIIKEKIFNRIKMTGVRSYENENGIVRINASVRDAPTSDSEDLIKYFTKYFNELGVHGVGRHYKEGKDAYVVIGGFLLAKKVPCHISFGSRPENEDFFGSIKGISKWDLRWEIKNS